MQWRLTIPETGGINGRCVRCGHTWHITEQDLKQIMHKRGSQGIIDACNEKMGVSCCVTSLETKEVTDDTPGRGSDVLGVAN